MRPAVIYNPVMVSFKIRKSYDLGQLPLAKGLANATATSSAIPKIMYWRWSALLQHIHSQDFFWVFDFHACRFSANMAMAIELGCSFARQAALPLLLQL